MVEVYVQYTGQNGQRTFVPGGPFANSKAAHDALEDFAVQQHGSWRACRALIDGYGFVVQGAGTVHVST